MGCFRRFSLVEQGEKKNEADDGKNTKYQTDENNCREGNAFGLFDLLIFIVDI